MSVRVCLVLALLGLGCSSNEDASPVEARDAALEGAADVAADTPLDAACTLAKPYSSKDTVCNGCAQAKCCAEVNGCLADPRCDDEFVNCILACALTGPSDGGDAGAEMAVCLADCASKYPVGKTEYDAAIGCVESKCSDVCK